MKVKKLKKFLFIIFLFPFLLFGQDEGIDSLKLALKNAKHDTIKCRVLSYLAENAGDDERMKYNNDMQEISVQGSKSVSNTSQLYFVYKKYESFALNNFGLYEYHKGNLGKALSYYEKSILISGEIKDKKRLGGTLSDMAMVYQSRGNVSSALDFNIRSLKLREEVGDKLGVANSLNNLGLIYDSQGDYSKAMEYFNKCLKICEELNDKMGIAYALNNIGYCYQNQNEYLKSLDFFFKSIKIFEESGDKYTTAYLMCNIGVFYNNYGDPSVVSSKAESIKAGKLKALEYFKKSLDLREEVGDKNGMAQSLSWIGSVYRELNLYDKALEYAKQGLLLSKETGIIKNIMTTSGNISAIYKATNNYKLALENYELHIQMRDSMNNEKTRKASIKTQLKYEYEKQAAADSVAHAKESEIKNVELAKQKVEITAKKNQQYALFGGLILVMIFAGFMFNRFKIMQKQKFVIEEQKIIVEEQKKIVEEKQKEILDSIHYAKRIQTAHLPNEKFISKTLLRLNKV